MNSDAIRDNENRANQNLYIDQIVETIGLRPDELEALNYLPFELQSGVRSWLQSRRQAASLLKSATALPSGVQSLVQDFPAFQIKLKSKQEPGLPPELQFIVPASRETDSYSKSKLNESTASEFTPSNLHSGVNHPKKTVNIMALGDVGSNLLLALRLLGGREISKIGIFDLDEKVSRRYEMEMNQMQVPFEYDVFPPVEVISEEDLFSCDVFVFCASKGVPPVDAVPATYATETPAPAAEAPSDVRMAQFEANRIIAAHYGKLAGERGFKGLFAVVSDPVDPLCKAVYLAASETGPGLLASQIQGYGLGVMNARAVYYANKDPRFKSFLKEGRSFGPHGQDLVIANSLTAYDDELSQELTALARDANLEVRSLGFKPYLAPAVSSAALSLLLTLSGDWHYSSVYLGKGGLGAFMGMKNRFTSDGLEYEREPLPKPLFERVAAAYKRLSDII